jgi:1-acyl-sn-glycerol-3-phosphate acyltransferase
MPTDDPDRTGTVARQSPPTLLRRSLLGLLRLFGWSTSLAWPPESKGIILVYPHTSNWDFIVGVLFRFGHGLPANWLGKQEMFRPPFRGLLERIGGIAVDRRAAAGFIGGLVEEFRRRDWMWVAVAPEGTRSWTDHWKSGFYRIALAADLPVGLAYIDYGRRQVGIDTYLRFSGDEAADFAQLRAFYADKRGRRPGLAGEIRLRAPRDE